MRDCPGFSDKDIETLHKPNNSQATRANTRTPAKSASPELIHAANDDAPEPVLDTQVFNGVNGNTDPIQDKTTRISTRIYLTTSTCRYHGQ
jgi:hypothetical protein